MLKRDFSELFMAKANLKTMTEAQRQVDLFIETMKDALAQDDVLIFRGLGTFEKRETKRKEGRNPRTGEAIKLTPKKYIKFSVGKDLDDRLNKTKAKKKK